MDGEGIKRYEEENDTGDIAWANKNWIRRGACGHLTQKQEEILLTCTDSAHIMTRRKI